MRRAQVLPRVGKCRRNPTRTLESEDGLAIAAADDERDDAGVGVRFWVVGEIESASVYRASASACRESANAALPASKAASARWSAAAPVAASAAAARERCQRRVGAS